HRRRRLSPALTAPSSSRARRARRAARPRDEQDAQLLKAERRPLDERGDRVGRPRRSSARRRKEKPEKRTEHDVVSVREPVAAGRSTDTLSPTTAKGRAGRGDGLGGAVSFVQVSVSRRDLLR